MKPIGEAFPTSDLPETVTLTCPTCRDERRVENGPAIGWVNPMCDTCRETEDAEIAKRERDNLIMTRLNRSNLPHTLRGRKVDGPLLELANAWAAPNPEIKVLTVHGRVGVGKTHFAAAAFRLALVNRPVTWIETARHMAMLQASFGDDERREAMRIFTGNGPAVFDDFDKIVDHKLGLPKLFAALDARIAQGSPVLVTMNSSLDEFLDTFGRKSSVAEPIVSRLRGGIVRKLTGPDRRRGQA